MRKSNQPKIQQNKTTPVQLSLTTVGHETRWAYSTTLPSPHVYKGWQWCNFVPYQFRQLVPLLTNKDVSLIMRGRLYSSCVRSSMLHGSETWPVRKENVVALQRAEVRITQQTVVFIVTAAAIRSLGHGLCTLTAVLRSTQPSTVCGTVKWVSTYGLNNSNNNTGDCLLYTSPSPRD